MTQSRAMSFVEAATNVVVGYVLAIATQIVVFPWFGIEAALGEHPRLLCCGTHTKPWPC